MFTSLRRTVLTVLAAGALTTVPLTALADGVSPADVSQAGDPGTSFQVTKTITTPTIPPKPDIVLVVDATGSMGSAINNVKSEMGTIVSTVQGAQPDAEFAVVSYRDTGDGPALFQVHADLTGDPAAAQAAVNTLSAGGGGDDPEAQLNALWQIGSGGNAISFRPDSSRIVVWFGDYPGHDPSNGHTEADAIASLSGVQARVLAISVGANQLDAYGQATRIAAATGGSLMSGIPASGLSAAILAGLSNLPAQVSAETSCDPGLSVSFDPALPQTVASGTALELTETVTIAADATQGATLSCTTRFMINGADAGPRFVQTVTVSVNDVTAPTVSCGPGVNPAGQTPAGWQSAGLFQLVADDNLPGVMVTITDSATGTSFGPYDPGTYVKLTQQPGAAASRVAEFEGAVDWHLMFKGDAILIATDAAGNTATAVCSVPPKKK